MIASVLNLSRSDCKKLKITDAYSIHRVVYDLFPSDKREFLFVDKGGDFNLRQILIVSNEQPKVPDLGEVVSKTIHESFLEKENYAFEVKVNPCKREKSSGKIKAVLGVKDLTAWFCQKGLNSGFEVDAACLEVKSNHAQTFELNKNKTVTHNSAVFIGKLKVTDQIKFKDSFKKGLGRAKAFGFGLFQVTPIN